MLEYILASKNSDATHDGRYIIIRSFLSEKSSSSGDRSFLSGDSHNKKTVGWAIITETKTLLINPTHELEQFCKDDNCEIISMKSDKYMSKYHLPLSDNISQRTKKIERNSSEGVQRKYKKCITIEKGLYLNNSFLYIVSSSILINFNHTLPELIKIVRRLEASTVLTQDGKVLTQSELLIQAIIS